MTGCQTVFFIPRFLPKMDFFIKMNHTHIAQNLGAFSPPLLSIFIIQRPESIYRDKMESIYYSLWSEKVATLFLRPVDW